MQVAAEAETGGSSTGPVARVKRPQRRTATAITPFGFKVVERGKAQRKVQARYFRHSQRAAGGNSCQQ